MKSYFSIILLLILFSGCSKSKGTGALGKINGLRHFEGYLVTTSGSYSGSHQIDTFLFDNISLVFLLSNDSVLTINCIDSPCLFNNTSIPIIEPVSKYSGIFKFGTSFYNSGMNLHYDINNDSVAIHYSYIQKSHSGSSSGVYHLQQR